MKNLQERILQKLTEKPSTLEYLVKATGSKAPSIRGRISELRKQGYNIVKEKGSYTEVSKYRLILKKTNVDIFLEKIDNYNLYNVDLNYDTLAKKFKMDRAEVVDIMVELNKRGKLIQTSNNSSKILL